jgi:hypothetical protein
MANVQTCKAGVTLTPVALNLWYVNNHVKSHIEMYHKYNYTLPLK